MVEKKYRPLDSRENGFCQKKEMTPSSRQIIEVYKFFKMLADKFMMVLIKRVGGNFKTLINFFPNQNSPF